MTLPGYIKTNYYGDNSVYWTEREFEAVERALRDIADGFTTEINGSGCGIQLDVYSTAGDDSWIKPDGAIFVQVICVGGGGGGASGSADTGDNYGSGGGGGGSFEIAYFDADDLGDLENVTVGAGGSGGAAISSASTTQACNNGSAGGQSSFGTTVLLRAYGGGGGTGKDGTTTNLGGGGGSARAVGGTPTDTSVPASAGFGAAVTISNADPSDGTHGGAAGGSGALNTSGAVDGYNGGMALFGGQGGAGSGGGGSGGAGGDAYAHGSWDTVSGGASGANDGSSLAGTIAKTFRGAGGGGGGGNTGTGSTGAGGDGQQPGGGGGGGGSVGTASGTITTIGSGGDGGDGIVVVVTWLCQITPPVDTTGNCTEGFTSVPSMTAYGDAEPGQPSVSGGQLTFLSADSKNWAAELLDCPGEMSNFELQFKAKCDKTTADSGGQYMEMAIFFREDSPTSANDPSSIYNCYVQICRRNDVIGPNKVLLQGRGIGNQAIVDHTVSNETTYKVIANGESLLLYIDGSLAASVGDNDPTVGTKIGIWQRSALIAGRVNYISDLTATVI